MTLGEEEVVTPAADGASIASSTMTSGLDRWNRKVVVQTPSSQHQSNGGSSSRRGSEGINPDSVSVLTYDPHLQHISTEDMLQQKEEELKELQHLHQVQCERLGETQTSLRQSQLQYKQQQREWKLNMEDVQSQNIVLQERLDVMEDDLHNGDLMTHMAKLISEEAPREFQKSQEEKSSYNSTDDDDRSVDNDDDHASHDDDDMKSVTSRASTSSGFRGLGFGRNRSNMSFRSNHNLQEQQRKKLIVYEDYITKLQAKLAESMHAMTVLTNQIQTMTDAQEEQLTKLRLELQVSEQERMHQEVTHTEALGALEHEKLISEQTLLAKLEVKGDRVQRLEELVEELRDMAHQGSLSVSTFEGTLALDNIKMQFDILSKEKDKLVQHHYEELESQQHSIKQLSKQNAKLERHIERLQSGDELTCLEQIPLGGGGDSVTSSSDDDDEEEEVKSNDMSLGNIVLDIETTEQQAGTASATSTPSSTSRKPDRIIPLQDEPSSSRVQGKSPFVQNTKRTSRHAPKESRYTTANNSHYRSKQQRNQSVNNSSSGSISTSGSITRHERHRSTSKFHRSTSSASSASSTSGGTSSHSRHRHTYVRKSSGDEDYDDDDANLHSSVTSLDLLEDEDKKLHVEQHRPVHSKELMQIQETKWSKMDAQSREKSQAVVNRFL